METSDLLLAAEVRKLAEEIRGRRWADFIGSADVRTRVEKDSPTYTQVKARWEAEHPLSHYVPNATNQLKRVADQLKSIDKGS